MKLNIENSDNVALFTYDSGLNKKGLQMKTFKVARGRLELPTSGL